ncbi:MAG: hypothetical protein ACXWDT_01510 [Solirubrobacterales bacterium]
MVLSIKRQGALAAPAAVLGLATLLVAGCGGGSDDGIESVPAPSAELFPKPDGQPLIKFLRSAATPVDQIVSPAGKVFRVGENRFAFGIFNVDRSQVTDAEVALYAAPGKDGSGPTSGPFPARIDALTTESAYHSKTTADDPQAALAAYLSQVEFDKPGPWTVAAMFREGDALTAVLMPGVRDVGQFDDVPAVGDKAPSADTDTKETVGDPKLLETRIPPDTMHDVNYADVLGKKPVVLLFASPALCVSRTCGPVTDVTEQVKQKFGDRVAFIHQEPYVDNQIQKGFRPPLQAFRLTDEPWVFVIDRNGQISSEIEGPFGVDELTRDVQRVAGTGT